MTTNNYFDGYDLPVVADDKETVFSLQRGISTGTIRGAMKVAAAKAAVKAGANPDVSISEEDVQRFADALIRATKDRLEAIGQAFLAMASEVTAEDLRLSSTDGIKVNSYVTVKYADPVNDGAARSINANMAVPAGVRDFLVTSAKRS